MEILKEGKVPFVKHFLCPYCECAFTGTLTDDEDMLVVISPKGERTFKADCPCCNKEVESTTTKRLNFE